MGFRIENFFSPSVRFLRDDELVFSASENQETGVLTKVQRATRSGECWKEDSLPIEVLISFGSFHASPKGTFPLSNGTFRALRIVETPRWTEVAKLAPPRLEAAKEWREIVVGSLRVFSPRESFLAVTGLDFYLTVYETKTWKEKRTWKPNGTPRSFGFTHDEKYLLTVGDDQTVRIWSCDNLEEVGSVRLPRSGLILPSPASNLVIVGYPEAQSRFVNVVERIEIYRVREP